MTQISGAIDNFKGTQLLGGWARCQDNQTKAPLHVRAYYDDCLMGETEANLPRADVGGNYGFYIELQTAIEADDIRSERFIITASASNGASKKLTFFCPMVENLELFCLGKKISETGDGGVRHLLAGLTTSRRPLLNAVKEAVERLDTTGNARFVGIAESKELSMFGLRLGLKSPDGTSVVGRNGTMFVLAGTNQLIDQYAQSEDDPAVQSKAKSWLSVFQVRQKRISILGSKYIQIIIPEKSSVLPDCFPISIEPPSALLRSIERLVQADPNVAQDYLGCFQMFYDNAKRGEVFRKVDSHLSAYGARFLFSEILQEVKGPKIKSTPFVRSDIMAADLGSKFLNSPLFEEVLLPDAIDFEREERSLRQLECYRPSDGRHIGTRVVWSNETATCPLTVLAFGNSFFERGALPTNLSWWAARHFKSFHFVWGPEVDFSYVESLKPDVVICQTNERFLSRVAQW